MGQSIEFFVVQYASTDRQRVGIGMIDRDLHQYPYRLMFDGSYNDLSFWVKIRIGLEEIRQKDPEIVVLPGYWDLSHWVLLAVARLQRRRVIISFDSTLLDHPRYWVKELVKKLFILQCDGGFTYGQRSKQYLKELGMNEEKITIRCQATANYEIRAAYDAAEPTRPELIEELGLASHNFCYIGRLSPEKNLSCLVQAFALLRQINSEARNWGLIIVGDGPERQALVNLCQCERLDHVKFVGGAHWTKVSGFLAASDVVVLPSVSEAWGLVVNEAMCCGLPVIVSDRCGCVDDLVVHGQTGFTFNPGSVEELCEHMDYFVRSPIEVRRFGERAEALISSYTPESAARQMLQGIRQQLQQRASQVSA
jgi:glycosyltransferase involved in cell wall biosynthesis